MTEPTTRPVDPSEQVAPVEQAIDGMLPAPAGLFDSTIEAGLEIKARSQWSYARRRFLRHRLAMVGLIGLVIIFGAGIFANFVAPYSYSAIDLNNILHPPTTTAHHFFGTDEIGRDYFSRVIWGIRTSEEVGVFVAATSSRTRSGRSSSTGRSRLPPRSSPRRRSRSSASASSLRPPRSACSLPAGRRIRSSGGSRCFRG